MTVCKAVVKGWWSPSPLCFFQISAGPLSPSAYSELCTVTGNVLWEASSKSAVCAGSRAHPTSAGFQKAAQNQSSLQAPEIKDRNIDALCQTAQATSQQCRLWGTLRSPCSDNGVNRMNTGNMRNICLSHGVATAKTTATVPNISKNTCYRHHILAPIVVGLLQNRKMSYLWDVSSQWNNENKSWVHTQTFNILVTQNQGSLQIITHTVGYKQPWVISTVGYKQWQKVRNHSDKILPAHLLSHR